MKKKQKRNFTKFCGEIVTITTTQDGMHCTSTVSIGPGSYLDKCLYHARPVTLDTVKLPLSTGALRRMK
jgi:energy-converting hydrogenase Eha subunit F